jgi:YVTN family beta-propeller protein
MIAAERKWVAAMAVITIVFAIVFGPAASGAEKETSYKLLKRVPIGGEGGWDYLAIDSDANRCYISHQTHVVVFDIKDNKVIGDINNTPGVHGITIVHKFNKGFISNGAENTVLVFDPKTLKEITRIKVGTKPDAIMSDSKTKRVFVFNGKSNDCTVIDPNTNAVLATISLGGKPEFAVCDKNSNVFVNIEDKSELAVIDSQKLVVTRRWSLAPGKAPSGLAIDRKNGRLFSVCDNGKMVISDCNAGKVIATAPIGKGPDGAGFDPKFGLAFSSNGGDGTLTVIKEITPNEFKAVQTVQTALAAKTMALNRKTHLIYLTAAKPKPTPPGEQQGRRKVYEPNTFELLIVGPSDK